MNQVIAMPMRETLDELVKTAAALNSESDQLNAVIEDFEEQLEKAGVGETLYLNAHYALDQSDWSENYDENTQRTWHESNARLLGYAKIDGKWRVAIKDVVLTKQLDDEAIEIVVRRRGAVQPLAQAPRAVRVEAAAYFETLAQALTEQMREHLKSITKAKRLVKE